MQIQCPSCHARARLSNDHEGTKVRCAECGRVYVARPLGGRRGPNTGLLIGAFAGALGLVVVVFVVRSCGAVTPARAAQLEAQEPALPQVIHATIAGWLARGPTPERTTAPDSRHP